MVAMVGSVMIEVNSDNWAAIMMRCMDEPLRDYLIDKGAPVVVDARKRFESRTAQAAGAYDFLPDMPEDEY